MFPLGHVGIALGIAYALDRAFLRKRQVKVDYRLVIVGALLPDVIDKPLSLTGLVCGRSFAHTLFFAAMVIAVVSVVVIATRKWWALVIIPLGVLLHLLLDTMWDMPSVILWPSLGLSFPVCGISARGLLDLLLSTPYLYLGEILGGVVVLAFIVGNRLYTKQGLKQFVRRGSPS